MQNDTTQRQPIYHTNGQAKPAMPQSDLFMELMLSNLASERDMMIPRLRYIETVLIQNGRISRRTVTSRGEGK